jgi:SAM-dependent methyltransferase
MPPSISGNDMTAAHRTSASADRRERQRAFWRSRYAEDPEFFGERESEFARWCVRVLQAERDIREIVELGCGYGRDTRFLSAQGFHVRGVDLAGVWTTPSPEQGPRYEFIESDCLEFLGREPVGRLDAVYSNMLFNMDFTEGEHRELMEAVHRVLRPGGLHLYSARSTSDPWYGRGRKVGPDSFDPAPDGITMHYFSIEYADRLARNLFTPVSRSEHAEGEGEFPIRLWYVVDRRDGQGHP